MGGTLGAVLMSASLGKATSKLEIKWGSNAWPCHFAVTSLCWDSGVRDTQLEHYGGPQSLLVFRNQLENSGSCRRASIQGPSLI
ncbi:hypothetical protein BJX62DRAFT_219767, partial [Aspergillus germanicus]